MGLRFQKDNNSLPSWCRGLAASNRHGGRSRKLGAYTMSQTHDAQSKLEVAQGLKVSNPLPPPVTHFL